MRKCLPHRCGRLSEPHHLKGGTSSDDLYFCCDQVISLGILLLADFFVVP
jgi:hypothetical protein